MPVAWRVHWVMEFALLLPLTQRPPTTLGTCSFLHSMFPVYSFTAHASGGRDMGNDVFKCSVSVFYFDVLVTGNLA
ncbi:hypothetical protein XELAEV_18031543mg [Xenopus laevis]|uniref:Secreted protein n=1 Tax=Xenopus laevis TaxID=8355 RepID=A0A974CMX0_XENLA|nr:hypothetical protein XELAEV_18031543mg [Xenopus laevis]